MVLVFASGLPHLSMDFSSSLFSGYANARGEPYSGFDPDIIDDLYQALDAQIPMQAA